MNPRTRSDILAAAVPYASPRIAAEEMLRAASRREPERDEKEIAIVAIEYAIKVARGET